MRNFVFLVVGLVISMSIAPVLAFQEKDQTAEIKQVVNHLFETMQKRDTEAMRSLFTPEGRMISTMTRNGKPVIRNLSIDDFAKMVTDTKEPYRERMFDMEARVEGDLATVWGHYDFHVGERLTNCGTNAFQLLRTPDGWRIIQVTSSIHIEGCQPSEK